MAANDTRTRGASGEQTDWESNGSSPTRSIPKPRKSLVVAYVVLGLLFVTVGFGMWGPFPRTLLTYGLIAAVLALSLELLLGFTGYISFGHAAWYGVGAYSVAFFSTEVSTSLIVGLVVGMAAAAVGGFVTGIFMARITGVYFAILSLAVSQVFYALVFIFSDATGGEDGFTGVPLPTVAGVELTGRAVWFWLVGAIVLGIIGLLYLIRNSSLGRTWSAIKSNEQRVRFVGINPYWYKVGAWTASACLAGLAGGLSVFFTGAIGPEQMSWHYSGEVLMYVILGGAGTIVGPAIGAVVFGLGEHYISAFTDSWLILFGGLAVLSVIIFPKGYGGAIANVIKRGMKWRS